MNKEEQLQVSNEEYLENRHKNKVKTYIIFSIILFVLSTLAMVGAYFVDTSFANAQGKIGIRANSNVVGSILKVVNVSFVCKIIYIVASITLIVGLVYAISRIIKSKKALDEAKEN